MQLKVTSAMQATKSNWKLLTLGFADKVDRYLRFQRTSDSAFVIRTKTDVRIFNIVTN